jgi:DNA-binding beta-propeller fold protein YncE
VDGSHLWVVSANGNSVTELNASTGSLVRVLSGHRYGFDNPIALAVVGKTIWIANGAGNSVTVVSSSTGAFVRYLG